MNYSNKIKQEISKIIKDYFTNNEIVAVFNNSKIEGVEAAYDKWETISKTLESIPDNQIFFHIIMEFCHPLNFSNKNKTLKGFIDNINNVLVYEDIEIQYFNDKNIRIVSIDGGPQADLSKPYPKEKTQIDYVSEILDYFREEFGKVEKAGLSYRYLIGRSKINRNDCINYDEEDEDYDNRLWAIKDIKQAGLITEFKIDESGSCDYVICKIDEQRLISEEINKEIVEERGVYTKNNKKRITLPSFPRTDWVNVSIRFTTDQSILLSNKKEVKPITFDGLGCEDERTGKPDKNWDFLLRLAKNKGQTESINRADRETQKKRKQKITDILRRIFKNDTDPFEQESGGVYKAKFEIDYINTEESKEQVKKEYLDLGDEYSRMTELNQ